LENRKTGKQENRKKNIHFSGRAVLLAFLLTTSLAQAGFWDPGLQRASVKTAFIANNEGSSANPITPFHPY
jgi:hypothetical protein